MVLWFSEGAGPTLGVEESIEEVHGVYHKVCMANGKPLYKSEEAGSYGSFSPKTTAYLWYNVEFAHCFLTEQPMSSKWDEMKV